MRHPRKQPAPCMVSMHGAVWCHAQRWQTCLPVWCSKLTHAVSDAALQGPLRLRSAIFERSKWQDVLNARSASTDPSTISASLGFGGSVLTTSQTLDTRPDIGPTQGLGAAISVQASLADSTEVRFEACDFYGNIANAGAAVYFAFGTRQSAGERASGSPAENTTGSSTPRAVDGGGSASSIVGTASVGAGPQLLFQEVSCRDNMATSAGGAIYIGSSITSSALLLFRNTTLATSRAAWGGGVFINGSLDGCMEVTPSSTFRGGHIRMPYANFMWFHASAAWTQFVLL